MTKSNLPKAAIVSSFWLRTRAFFGRWSGKIGVAAGVMAITASVLWCGFQIDACMARKKAECKALGDKRIEIVRFKRTDKSILYYALNPTTLELVEHGLDYAKVIIDVPPTEKPYIITSVYSNGIECKVSGDVHLRSAAEVE